MGKDDSIKCLIKITGTSLSVSERGSEQANITNFFDEYSFVLKWTSFNDAYFLVDFRVAEVTTASSLNATTGPMTRVHRKTNHQLKVSICARNQQSGKSGTFACSGGVDPAEAFNCPSGQLLQTLQVRSTDPTRPFPAGSGGVPRVVKFCVVALRDAGVPPSIPERSFHEQCILVDQFVLDCGDASSRKGTTSYGFGFLTDISEGSAAKNLTRYTQDLLAPLAVEGGVATVDFSQLQHATTSDALERNPVDFCIVSVDSKSYNNVTVGNRIISSSRFKTGEKGLCKPSLKAQLVLCLIRSDGAGNKSLEVNEDASLDLAGEVMNIETVPDEGVVRRTNFSYGESLYYRIRRRCFVDPTRHGDRLLTPQTVLQAPQGREEGTGDGAILPPPPLRKEESGEAPPKPLYSPTV